MALAVRERISARRIGQWDRGRIILGVLAGWLVLFFLLRGTDTLPLGPGQLTDLHHGLNNLNDSIGQNRNSSPIFLYFFNEIRLFIDEFVVFLQSLFAQPSFGRPLPLIGWLGVVALVGWVSYAVANVRVALLAAAG